MEMRLSKNFTLAEMVATSHGKLQDTPTLEVIQNLQKLCVHVLQPLRDTVGAPVYINSGYRSKRLNALVGGVPNSRHLLGKAADIHCDNMAYAKVVFDILKQNKYVTYTYIGSPTPACPPSRMGIRSPLWGRSHAGGCSEDPSRPKGGGRSVWVHVQM